MITPIAALQHYVAGKDLRSLTMNKWVDITYRGEVYELLFRSYESDMSIDIAVCDKVYSYHYSGDLAKRFDVLYLTGGSTH